MNKIEVSLHDHRFSEGYSNNTGTSIYCSCGLHFDKEWLFNDHQKQELNKQLKNTNVEVV